MVLWVFDGDMVGKWTNEPCNGVDEVVNHFWVLTGIPAYNLLLVSSGFNLQGEVMMTLQPSL